MFFLNKLGTSVTELVNQKQVRNEMAEMVLQLQYGQSNKQLLCWGAFLQQ